MKVSTIVMNTVILTWGFVSRMRDRSLLLVLAIEWACKWSVLASYLYVQRKYLYFDGSSDGSPVILMFIYSWLGPQPHTLGCHGSGRGSISIATIR